MSTDILTIIVVTLGPVLIYATVALVLQLPELVAGWSAGVRHSIEVAGGFLVAMAWLTIDTVGGALAMLGLLLLLAPTVARYLSQVSGFAPREQVPHTPKTKKSARFM